MDIKLLAKKILFWVSVPKCIFCGEKLDFLDRALCSQCRERYEQHKSRNCSRCSKELRYCTCSNEYLRSHSIKRHLKMFRYIHNEATEAANQLIYSLKQDNREDVIDFLADELAGVINYNLDLSSGPYIITNVPRSRKSTVNYGFDHTEQLARCISKKTGLNYKRVFVSNVKRKQKGLTKIERVQNATYDYKKNFNGDLSGCRLIIVDDVTTSGATLSACAVLAKGLRAKEVIALTVASAYNDEYEKRIEKRDKP